MNRLTLVILQCFANSIFCHTSQWSYNNQENWPIACIDGYLQSPIPIYQEETISLKNVPKLKFNSQYLAEYRANITNDGHSVKITFEEARNRPSISGGMLVDSYLLDSFHFHWGAEHIIDDRRYPLEGHFVHYAKKYGNLQQAVNFSDGVLVLAVFYELYPLENNIFFNLINNVEEISHQVNKPKRLKHAVNIFKFLSTDFTQYYQYEGSLTTPGCNEVVTWIVFLQPSFIEKYQLELFEAVFDKRHRLIDSNYREEQEVNDRDIYFISK